MPPLESQSAGMRYWRSLDELTNTDEFRTFVENEFPNFAPEMLEGPTRRGFLKVMGASLALAGLAGCRWPKENILAYSNRPDNRIPGVPVHYATAFEMGGFAQGLLVSSFDGRPIKIEGNDQHPTNRGAANAFAQASLLELYDPDRSTRHWVQTSDGRSTMTWGRFLNVTRDERQRLRQNQGQGLRILTEATSSPTFADVRTRFQQAFPKARWTEFEPLATDNLRAGTVEAFGEARRLYLDLSQADVIVSLDDDFLMLHPDSVRLTREFAARRRPAPDNQYDMNRLYVFETGITVTGSRADERKSIRAARMPELVNQLWAAVEAAQGSGTVPDGPLAREAATALGQELVAHAGRALVTAGAHLPPDVHAAVCAINGKLGAFGNTVRLLPDLDAERESHAAGIRHLVEEMRAGTVETLLIIGGNPAHNAPADLKFGEALAQVGTRIHLATHNNETTRACTHHIARTHYLESWGDSRATDGTVSIVQPLIAPLFDPPNDAVARSPIEVLAAFSEDEFDDGYSLVRRTFMERFVPAGADPEQAWQAALHAGLVSDSAQQHQRTALQAVPRAAQAAPNAFDVVFVPDPRLYDGRFANNGWMQELPDPLAKLTWDNAALISPQDAKTLGVKRGDHLRIELGGRSLEIPAFVLPGQAEKTITLTLGYGTEFGVVSEGTGFNTYDLKTTTTGFTATGANVQKAGGYHLLATTQDHHYMDAAIADATIDARADRLVREETLEHFKHHPRFAAHAVHLPVLEKKAKEYKDTDDVVHEHAKDFQQLFRDVDYIGEHQWAMAIDLSACTGCNACVVACNAENNIPVVGKEEVHMGREMHWIRVDRYFKGDPDNIAGVAHQPLTCHHCENAPCEQVCPVAATVHDEEGLNVMVYNRCIGTRYCSNNCPFKVRRFNWFYNHHGPKHPRGGKSVTPIEQMRHNPRVTVRSRGVMEKCTFCTQRINDARIKLKNQRIKEDDPTIKLVDGAITPACAQTCPAEAIVFGDRNDADSRVHKLIKDHPRGYYILAELNVRARLKYLARINNPPKTAATQHGEADKHKEPQPHQDAAKTTPAHG